jgi:hypothetical protein
MLKGAIQCAVSSWLTFQLSLVLEVTCLTKILNSSVDVDSNKFQAKSNIKNANQKKKERTNK